VLVESCCTENIIIGLVVMEVTAVNTVIGKTLSILPENKDN
jgi:hypothetical protein